MKLLVISDLHIGDKARTKDLCPYPQGLLKEDKLVRTFIDSAKQYQKTKGKFDFLIIPGDITHKSNLLEYECGARFLDRVSAELKIKESKIIFVPGNHDVDWSILEGIPEEEKPLRRKHKYNTLKDKSHSFSKMSGNRLTEDPFIQKWEYPDVIFFGFNSSWHDDSIHKNHYGLISLEQIDLLRRELEKANLDKLKIFVVHHHLHQFDNPHPSWIDISVMQNSQPLINLLSEFSFNFIVHGHRHLPRFLSTSIANFNPINILCSGSYSVEIPTDIAGYVGNTYHIIEIDEFKNDICKGRVLSMAYDSRQGWVQSKPNHGIDYENPFGNEIGLQQLIGDCVKETNQFFMTNQTMDYGHLVSKVPELGYLPLLSKAKLLGEVQKACNCKTATTIDDVIFIKNNK